MATFLENPFSKAKNKVKTLIELCYLSVNEIETLKDVHVY